MRKLLFLFTLFLAGLSYHAVTQADIYYADDEGDTVQVTAQPCPATIATKAPEGMRGYFFLAHAKIGSDTGPACAALVTHKQREGPQVMIMFETGDKWMIKFEAFTANPPTKAG